MLEQVDILHYKKILEKTQEYTEEELKNESFKNTIKTIIDNNKNKDNFSVEMVSTAYNVMNEYNIKIEFSMEKEI